MFSATEALGLVMAVLDGHHDVSDPASPAGSALGKIVRALPEPVAAQAEAVRRAAAPAPDPAAARPDPDTTAALVRACSDHRRVRLRYRSEAGSEWDADVEAIDDQRRWWP
jgi:predicted DNA-binding transcriptional regulator YafY